MLSQQLREGMNVRAQQGIIWSRHHVYTYPLVADESHIVLTEVMSHG